MKGSAADDTDYADHETGTPLDDPYQDEKLNSACDSMSLGAI